MNNIVYLIHYHNLNEWLLARGCRNCDESRFEAALRETHEETGFKAHFHPVEMQTRAPPKDAQGHDPDKARSYQNLTEHLMVTMRQLGVSNVKVIWWYVAA
jgi:8-oxo-dGTP pyrophosphatase MutT (NUDIX family)